MLQDHCPGVYRLSSGLVQLAVVWCAREPAEEGSVCAECCHWSTDQHRALWPHHTSVVSTTLAASSEVSGVQIACLVHQSVASKALKYLTADIRLVSEHGGRSLYSTSNRTLAIPHTCSSFGDRSFADMGPRLWNSLPTNLRQMTSYEQFRRHLKSHLFRDF